MSVLGKKMTPQLAQELDNRQSTRIEGACIKRHRGKDSVKMYDKFRRVLRIETTTNDVSFFEHYRKGEHRDGHATRERAAVKKSIYSLIDLREILLAQALRQARIAHLRPAKLGHCPDSFVTHDPALVDKMAWSKHEDQTKEKGYSKHRSRSTSMLMN